MQLGFETIGSATIICHDRKPILITDPWVVGSAFFGSWALTHQVPEEQFRSICEAEFVWFSHGHPDHLNHESLQLFRGKKILLPDHAGKRIYSELLKDGLEVRILRDRVWYQLSNRIRVLCMADYNQDAVLLIDMDGRLLVNLNDASDHGWGTFVRKTIKQYETSFLLALECTEDIDMFNLYDEFGNPLPRTNARENPLGRRAAMRLANFGAKYFVPFSSMHHYQREDSVWANEYGAPLSDYELGTESMPDRILSAFIRYDCTEDKIEEICPQENKLTAVPAAEFGDDWKDELESSDKREIDDYFLPIEHLYSFLDFVNIRVGGKDHHIPFKGRNFKRGLTFEAPRGSLMTAVQYKVFDDLLIGNFMRTIFHGQWSNYSLYPNFSPYVAKYADNGNARSEKELEDYFRTYRKRSPAGYVHAQMLHLIHRRLERQAIDTFRLFVPRASTAYKVTKKIFRAISKPKTL